MMKADEQKDEKNQISVDSALLSTSDVWEVPCFQCGERLPVPPRPLSEGGGLVVFLCDVCAR